MTLSAGRSVYRQPPVRLSRSRHHVKFDPGALLQIGQHIEQIAGLRIAAGAEHADEALGLGAGGLAQLLEADRRLDVIAQDRLAGVDVAGEHCIDSFAQQRVGESPVGRDVLLHQFLEASVQWHIDIVTYTLPHIDCNFAKFPLYVPRCAPRWESRAC